MLFWISCCSRQASTSALTYRTSELFFRPSNTSFYLWYDLFAKVLITHLFPVFILFHTYVQRGRFPQQMQQRYLKEKTLTCGCSFKLEPESQFGGLGWITTGFVLMCCGHQIASLLLHCFWLLRGQQVHTDVSETNTPPPRETLSSASDGTWSANYKFNESHTTATYNYMIPMNKQPQSFLWHEVTRSSGNVPVSRTQFLFSSRKTDGAYTLWSCQAGLKAPTLSPTLPTSWALAQKNTHF